MHGGLDRNCRSRGPSVEDASSAAKVNPTTAPSRVAATERMVTAFSRAHRRLRGPVLYLPMAMNTGRLCAARGPTLRLKEREYCRCVSCGRPPAVLRSSYALHQRLLRQIAVHCYSMDPAVGHRCRATVTDPQAAHDLGKERDGYSAPCAGRPRKDHQCIELQGCYKLCESVL